MNEKSTCIANFGVPEFMKSAKTKVIKVDLPGFHRFQQKIFHNYCLMILYFEKGEIRYIPWLFIFGMISQLSPIRKMDEEDIDELRLEEILENSEQLGDDIESIDLSEMANILDLSLFLLELYQRYNEPDNIFVSEWNNPPKHERN